VQTVIDDMHRNDWAQVYSIYRAGLATGLAAFMTSPPKWDSWNADHLAFGRYVARGAADRILGFAALSPVPDT
jgi:phosphinothricin acetyltransferase